MRTALPLVVFAFLVVVSVGFAAPEVEEELATFVGDGDFDARIEAGLALAGKDPDQLAEALEKIVKEEREGDADLLARIAVQVKVPHIRLLLVNAASEFDDAGEPFLARIDNDHPIETSRAIEALGFLRYGDATEKLLFLARGKDELIGVAAARALARTATKRQSKEIAEAVTGSDIGHVRLHLTWALRDIMGSGRAAGGLLARSMRDPGTVGYRAKEAVAALEDEDAPSLPYKAKLTGVEDFFGRRGGPREPSVNGPDEYKPEIEKSLQILKEKAPDWYHLVASVLTRIDISGNEQILDFSKNSVNLRLRDLIMWKDGKTGELRHDLVAYYLVRFTTIVFLEELGDPSVAHRGWEEGITAAWWYAMDHTKIAVDEDLTTFLEGVLNANPPPW